MSEISCSSPGRAVEARRSSPWVFAAVAGVAAILVRIPFFFWPLTSDEGGYAYTAHWWARGATLYSTDLWLDRSQGIVAAYLLGMRLLGEATWAIRLWGAFWSATSVLLVYLIARRLWNDRAACTAALLCAIFGAAPQIEGFTANAEVFATTAALGSVYCLLGKRYGAAGLLASMACLLKPSGISAVLVAAVWLAFERAGFRAFSRFVLGALPLPMAAVAQGLYSVGWSNYVYAVAGHGVRASAGAGSHLLNFVGGCSTTWPAWIPLGICGALGCVRLPRRQLVFLGALVSASFMGMALGGHWFPHYFIQIVPPLAICAAIAIDRRLGKTPMPGTATAALLSLLALALIAPLALQRPIDGSQFLYGRQGYLIAADAARYVRAHSNPDDLLYVAFAEADIYHLAQRRAAVANIYRRELLYIPGAYERVAAAIEAKAPTYVLALDAPLDEVDPGRRFWRALEANYHVETSFGTVPLYRRNQP